MQHLWSRAAQSRSTCRCPSCITSSRQALSRQTTTDAVRFSPFRYYGHRFAFYSSSILATATFADSLNKDKKQKELSRQIKEARDELIARQAEQDRRLEALGISRHHLEKHQQDGYSTGEARNSKYSDELDGAWNSGNDDNEDYNEHTNVLPKDSAHYTYVPAARRYGTVRDRYIKSILDNYKLERQSYEPSLSNDEQPARNLMDSNGPLKWSSSPEADRHVEEFRTAYGPSNTMSREQSDPDAQQLMNEQILGDPVHDLRILQMREHPDFDDRSEHLRECMFEHQVHFDLYLQNLHNDVPSDDPCEVDQTHDWCSLLEWAKVQKAKRKRLGFGKAPGILLQELQAFTPTLLKEITETGSVMDMVQGIPSRDAARVPPYLGHLSEKKKALMARAVYKLVLSITQLFYQRDNTRRYQLQLPPLPIVDRQELINFWSYYIRISNEAPNSEHETIFPVPPLPIYQTSLSRQKIINKLVDKVQHVKKILRSQQSHETTMNLICIELLHSNIPLDIHAFNEILMYLSARSDYDLVALFIQFLDESHLRPNEVTVTWILQYYRLSGRRQGFQQYVARMYGRIPCWSSMVRNPMLMIPFLARPKFVIEKPSPGHPALGGLSKVIELKDEPYRPYPTDQQRLPRIFEKARRNQHVYSQLIQGALTFGYVEDAFDYWVEMVRYGWECTQAAFASLLKHCADTRNWITGFGIWERRKTLIRFPNAKVYIQALKLCIVCGRRTEYQDILAEGIRSETLAQDGSWPVTTLYNGDSVSTHLSWVIGLEAELRIVTNALALEVEVIKRCLDNTCEDSIFYPVDVRCHLLQEKEVISSHGPSMPNSQSGSMSYFKVDTVDAQETRESNTSVTSQFPSDSLHKKQGESAAQQSRADVTEKLYHFKDTHTSKSKNTGPDWSHDFDPGFDHPDNSVESFKELENLLSLSAVVPDYSSQQGVDNQEHVVSPTSRYRKARCDMDTSRDLEERGDVSAALFDYESLAFYSVRLDCAEAEHPVVLPTTTLDVTKNLTDQKGTCNRNKEATAKIKQKALKGQREEETEVTFVSSDSRSYFVHPMLRKQPTLKKRKSRGILRERERRKRILSWFLKQKPEGDGTLKPVETSRRWRRYMNGSPARVRGVSCSFHLPWVDPRHSI